MNKLNLIDLKSPTNNIDAPQLKKPYRKPSFRFETVFETTALSCGKIDPTQVACHMNRKNS